MTQAAELEAVSGDDTDERFSRKEMSFSDVVQLALALAPTDERSNARILLQKVLDADPNYVDALNVMGYVSLLDNDPEAAVGYLKRAAEILPDNYSVLNNLGNTQLEVGDVAGAVATYKKAIKIDQRSPDAFCNLAGILNRQGDNEMAEKLLRHVLSFAPDSGIAHLFLSDVLADTDRQVEAQDEFHLAAKYLPKGVMTPLTTVFGLMGTGQVEQAKLVLRGWIEEEPDNPAPRHMLAGLMDETPPDRAPDAYVEQVFDRFAGTFDSKLSHLHYEAPALVGKAVATRLGAGRGDLDVLDAGCGTGLCAEHVRAYARRLDGVDLSAKMLNRAERLKLYDELAKGELTEYMATRPLTWDLIISADTLCYFGRIDEAAAAARDALRPGGVLVFSVEEGAADVAVGYKLAFNGRYQHDERYVRAALEGAGLAVDAIEKVVLRLEAFQPVHGLLVTASRPA